MPDFFAQATPASRTRRRQQQSGPSIPRRTMLLLMDEGEPSAPVFLCSAEYKFADAVNGKRVRGSLRHTSSRRRRAYWTLAALHLLTGSLEAAKVAIRTRKVTEASSLGGTRSHLDTSASSVEAAAVAGTHIAGIRSVGRGPPYVELNKTGGQFGFDADWRFGVQEGGGGEGRGWDGVRGETCMTEDKRREVQEVLLKRRVPPGSQKVAACLRTKDYGRYLPEWLAFHYSLGVDEVSVYDDESSDGTLDILRPFIKDGLVRYVFHEIDGLAHEMEPLNLCLNHYLKRKKEDAENAPQWLLFHDTDEYIYPVDTSLTLFEGLQRHFSTCCVLVPRIKYGSGGYSETPQGLLIDNFITHQNFTSHQANQKVMVNLEPTLTESVSPKLRSMHNAEGCDCHRLKDPEMRINHYLGSHGDHMTRLARYWKGYVANKQEAEERFRLRDDNDATSDTITHWSCTTREILYRIASGLDLETGL